MKTSIGLKIGDVLLIAGILLLAAGLLLRPLWYAPAQFAEIVIAETAEVQTVSLSVDDTYTVTSRGITLTVSVSGGAISVTQSDCRDGICKNTPPIRHAGQSIVCAPAGVVVRITGEEAVVDGVSG